MNYLLDTHAFLWMLGAPERLPEKVKATIRNPDRAVFVSAVTAVEIAIKRALGKLEAPMGLWEEARDRGLLELSLKYAHGEALEGLPAIHGDPFDRMLIAQAKVERLTVITRDRRFEDYPVGVYWG